MNQNDYIIRPETPADYREVEALTREAFWNVYRPGCMEHCVLHNYRQLPDFIPELSLVLELGGKIVAHIMYSRAKIVCDDGRHLPILIFGPLSVLPEYQRKGFGGALINYSLDTARALGCGAVAITGNPDYYTRFGFVDAQSKGVFYGDVPRGEPTPFFMVKELRDGWLDGIVGTYTDPDGYFVSEEAVDAFDAAFPPKTKLKLPGQLL